MPKVAIRLGIPRSTAYALIQQGLFPLPAIRLGRRIVISAELVDRLLANTLA